MTKKGEHRTEEQKRKQSLAMKGRSSPNKGKHMWLDKPHPRGMLGKKNPIMTEMKLGKSYQEQYGIEKANAIREKMSLSKKGKSPHPQTLETRIKIGNFWRGKLHDEEWKKNQSKAQIIRFSKTPVWNRGIPATEEHKKNNSVGLIKYYDKNPQAIETHRIQFNKIRPTLVIPFRDSKPEKILQNALKELKIEFVKHKSIKLLNNHYHQVDIFIEPNIVIEADGDYWHNLPEQKVRDRYINYDLIFQNYKIYRFWEHDIRQKR